MNCRIAIAAISILQILAGNLGAQQTVPNAIKETRYVDGLMTGKKKYSFTVIGSDQAHQIKIGPATVIAARILRPKFDWVKRSITGTIPASAPDGRTKNNLKVTYPLGERIYFRSRFSNAEALKNSLANNPVRIERPIISLIPIPTGIFDGEKPEWAGELQLDKVSGVVKTKLGDGERTLLLSAPTVLLEGLNILDLKPYETDVFVNADETEGQLVAKRVEFAPRINLKNVFERPEPKCLIIGDTVSFNYQAALIKELRGEATMHHPNANCLGSGNFKHLHRWVPQLPEKEFQWDVIAFNFGLADSSLDKATYQKNLIECVTRLKSVGSNLIWIESTPVPYGFNDANLKTGEFIPADKQFDFEFEESNPKSLKPGRLKMQNQWAAEVLVSHPEIAVCKLWEVVKNDKVGVYKKWWYGKSPNFKFPQSQPLAKALADSIRKKLKD